MFLWCNLVDNWQIQRFSDSDFPSYWGIICPSNVLEVQKSFSYSKNKVPEIAELE